MIVLKSLDIFGISCHFYFSNNETYSTKFGGFVVVLMSFTMAVLFLLFGSDFYYRTNPMVSTELGNFESYPNYTLSNSNFTFIFALEDENGKVYNNDATIYLELYQIIYSSDEYIERSLPLTRCKSLNFSEDLPEGSSRFEDYFCLDLTNFTVGGLWDSNYLSYFALKVNECVSSSTTILCSEDKDPLLLKNILYLSLYTQKYLFNPSDYSQPLRYSLINDYMLLDVNIFKVKRYFFTASIANSNNGWLFDSETFTQALSFDKVEYDINLKRESDNTLGSNILYFDKRYTLYKRNYQKLQTLAANVGGVMKFFIVIGSFIVKKYNQFYLFKDLSDSISLINLELDNSQPKINHINFVNRIPENPKLDLGIVNSSSIYAPNSLHHINLFKQVNRITKEKSLDLTFTGYLLSSLTKCLKNNYKLEQYSKGKANVSKWLDIKDYIKKTKMFDECSMTKKEDKLGIS